MDKLLGYLTQQSTWKGIFQIVAGLGIFAPTPELQAGIISFGIAMVGLINTIRDEKALAKKNAGVDESA